MAPDPDWAASGTANGARDLDLARQSHNFVEALPDGSSSHVLSLGSGLAEEAVPWHADPHSTTVSRPHDEPTKVGLPVHGEAVKVVVEASDQLPLVEFGHVDDGRGQQAGSSVDDASGEVVALDTRTESDHLRVGDVGAQQRASPEVIGFDPALELLSRRCDLLPLEGGEQAVRHVALPLRQPETMVPPPLAIRRRPVEAGCEGAILLGETLHHLRPVPSGLAAGGPPADGHAGLVPTAVLLQLRSSSTEALHELEEPSTVAQFGPRVPHDRDSEVGHGFPGLLTLRQSGGASGIRQIRTQVHHRKIDGGDTTINELSHVKLHRSGLKSPG